MFFILWYANIAIINKNCKNCAQASGVGRHQRGDPHHHLQRQNPWPNSITCCSFYYTTLCYTTLCNCIVVHALEKGWSPQLVMTYTGHEDYDSMKPYIALTDKTRKDMMETNFWWYETDKLKRENGSCCFPFFLYSKWK